MKTKLLLLSIAVLCLSVSPAMAIIYPTESVTFGTSWDGAGKQLQDILDGMTVSPVAGDSHVDTTTDALKDSWDSLWEVTATTNATSTFIIEISGKETTNTFGLYEPGNTSNWIEVFDGAASTGSKATIYLEADGSISVQPKGGTLVNKDLGGNLFGFYLGTVNGPVFYSDSALNTNNADQMVAYQGNDIDYVDVLHPTAPVSPGGLWTTNEFILAWEDLLYDPSEVNSDNDYNDMVLMVESVVPVPVPGAVLLGLLGLGFAGRKLRKFA